MKNLFLIAVALFIAHASLAQEVLENNSPKIKWYRIKSPNFNVLYPKGFETQAQRVANTLEHIRDSESKSLGRAPRKISVILQNQSSISNGFVTLIPRRSEFFTMPTQDYNFGGTNDWLNQLATHEFRHVVQYQNSNTGFSKALNILFGPATLAAIGQVSVPQWFWEGDAVATETAFTHSGRGRIPNFNLLMKTNLQEGRVFNYHKQYLRSYKHNIPDHYVLGYNMVAYLRKRTGDPDIWKKITHRAWSVPFIPFTFSNAIKRESGLHVTQLYNEMALDLQKTWNEQLASVEITPFKKLMERKTGVYTSYHYPQQLSDGSVLAMKIGIGDIEQFVVLKDGKESKAFTPGIFNDAGMLSAAGTKVVWTEFGFDPRWQVHTYSRIKGYDVATHKHWVITSNSRYSAAAISPDEKKIVTIESTTEYEVSVLIVDSKTGSILKRFSNPKNAFYSMPRWSNDGKKIVALKTQNGNRSVVSFDYESGKEVELIAPSKENIGHPVLFNKLLFYNSPISGIDNIYVLDIESQKRLQVTSSKYGAYNPNVSSDGKIIIYNDQSRNGMDVVSIPLNPETWREPSGNQFKGYDSYLAEQEGRPSLIDSIPQKQFTTAKYSKLSGIINPYSWGAYFNPSFTQADFGISSQDILSTTSLKAGYLYDITERTGAWHAGVSYQNWFPIIDVDVKYAKRSVNEGDITYENSNAIDTTSNLTFKWEEKNIQAGLRIPLITTNSKYYGSLSVSNYFGYTRVSNFENSIDGGGRIITNNNPQYFFRTYQDNGTLLYNRFGLTAYRLLKQSRRDINSKFGQVLYMNWDGTPYGGDFSGNQFAVYSVLYFPGLFKHHSIWGYWAFQDTKIDRAVVSTGEGLNNYIFSNQIPTPRGLGSYIGRFQKFYSMSANYTLPIWYPDIALGPVLNLQRLRGNAFLDYGFGSSVFGSNAVSQTYISVGGELKMDINIMRFLPQFNVGFRYSYGLQPSVTKLEFLIGIVNF